MEVTEQELEHLVRRTLRRASPRLRRTAFHEAAHAVVAHVRRIHVAEVHIEESENSLGKCYMARPSDPARLRDDYLPAILAGAEIEKGRFRVHPDVVHTSCETDDALANDVIAELWRRTQTTPWEELSRCCLDYYWDCLENAQKTARQVIRTHDTALRQVAALLIAVTYVGDDTLAEIVDQDDHRTILARRLSEHLSSGRERGLQDCDYNDWSAVQGVFLIKGFFLPGLGLGGRYHH